MDINKLAAMADKLQKSDYNKSAIYITFKDAINNDGKFDECDMARLYAYFSPATPASPKTDTQWLAHAMAKNDVRYYLNYIHSDGKRLMATDGHRVHIIKSTDYSEGFFDKNMHRIDVDGKFPDIDRVIPKETTKQIRFSELTPIDYEGNTGKNAQVYLFNDVMVNAQYLKQAAQYFDDPVVRYTDKGSAVMIEDDTKIAVIMPLRH